jgi:CTP:molybdopterin cytidylyltransferase MocA
VTSAGPGREPAGPRAASTEAAGSPTASVRPPGAPAGVLLAAGAGTRFGRPKALVEFDGEPLVTRGVALLRAGGCEPVLVVLGADSERVTAEADLTGAEVVVNARWATGMASSFVAGLDALRGRAPAAVIALVDQPLVTPEVVRRLAAAWRDGAAAAVAAYDGRPRNPVLLDASVWDEVSASVSGDEGARDWLRANPRAVAVECADVGAPHDVDTRADLDLANRARTRRR